jgi:hypothetical protein
MDEKKITKLKKLLLNEDIETQIQGVEILSCFDDAFIHACFDSFDTPPIDPKSKILQEPYYINLWYLCFCAERGKNIWPIELDLDLVQLPENIGFLQGIWELKATNPDPEQLKMLPKIYSCSVIESFPEWLQHIPSIQKVICDDFENNCLPDWIQSVDNIERLEIVPFDDYQDFELPSHLSDNISYLDICSMNILNPKVLETIKYGLVMNYSDLVQIPKGREEIIHGISFFNQPHSVSEIPEKICTYKNTEVLFLGNQRLSTFPEILRTMPRIREIFLFGNPIKELPTWLPEIRELQYLRLDKSYIFSVKDTALILSLSKNYCLWNDATSAGPGIWIYRPKTLVIDE